MCNAAQRDNGVKPGQGGDLRLEENPAGLDLLRRRLVFRRHAANRIGDQRVCQYQSVIDPLGILTTRETEATKRRVEKMSGIVACEGPSGAISAVQSWCQPHNQQARIRITEGGNRRIEPVWMSFALHMSKRHQPRA